MQSAILDIVGKRIAGVVVKEGRHPRSQVFLVFDDDTHYELYADAEIQGIKSIGTGGIDKVRTYSTPPNCIIMDYYSSILYRLDWLAI
jgi:hypothetical protein